MKRGRFNLTFDTDSVGVSFHFKKLVHAVVEGSLAQRLLSSEIAMDADGNPLYSIKERARCEAMMQVGFDPLFDEVVAVDPGRTDLFTGLFLSVEKTTLPAQVAHVPPSAASIRLNLEDAPATIPPPRSVYTLNDSPTSNKVISASSDEFYVLSSRVQATECRAGFIRDDIQSQQNPMLRIEAINSATPPQKTGKSLVFLEFIKHKLTHYARLTAHHDLNNRYRNLKMRTYRGISYIISRISSLYNRNSTGC